MNDFLSIEDLSEEDLDAILGLGTAEDKAAQLENQLAMANKIRTQQGPEGRGYGGVYTAANPLEHAVYAWQGIRAGKDAEKLSGEQDALMQSQIEARKKFFESMIQRQNAQQLPPQSGYGPQPFDPEGVY